MVQPGTSPTPSPNLTILPRIVDQGLCDSHPLRGAVLLLGNFDGFHVGHQALAAMARRIAPLRPVAVMACEPHPRAFFGCGAAPGPQRANAQDASSPRSSPRSHSRRSPSAPRMMR